MSVGCDIYLVNFEIILQSVFEVMPEPEIRSQNLIFLIRKNIYYICPHM